jgi:5-methylcytosine-specific restriction protein A
MRTHKATHAGRIHKPRGQRPESANLRGYNYRWQLYTKRRRREHPICEALHCDRCQRQYNVGTITCTTCRQPLRGCHQPSTCTDHITPVHGPDDRLFWDERNHQDLCWSCHSSKTAKEDGGFGRRKVTT